MKERQQGQRHRALIADDAEYLHAEYSWLAVISRRLSAERMLRDVLKDDNAVPPSTPGTREMRGRVMELREEERETRQEIDGRLAAHRQDPGAVQLGLDEMCEEYGLCQEERTILLALSIPAIGRSIAEELLGDIISCYGSLTVEDVIRILDPNCVSDWLRFRSFLRPDGRLLQENLISLVLSGEPSFPDTFIAADVRITIPALTRMTGDEGLLFETELPAFAEEQALGEDT
jgi:hypothetical protein